jgi:two-component system chemotaxis sensor kinase CheA
VSSTKRQQLVAKFHHTTRTRISAVSRGIVSLEHGSGSVDVAVTDEVARELHTLKGEARLLGFEPVADVAHDLEALVLSAIEHGALRDPEFVAAVLQGLDRIEQHVGGGQEDSPAATPASTAVVDFDSARLSKLADRTTALALSSGRSEALLRELEEIAEEAGTTVAVRLRHLVTRAREEARASETAATELLESVRDLQMVSLGDGLARYPRAVRELSAEQGKRVRLVVDVGAVQIDRDVLDRLHEPVLHVLRNCVDHGCERPQERAERGKTDVATISIRAARRGSDIELEISDDGRGIAVDEVVGVARRRGLIDAATVLDDEEARQLLFAPGFSTRSEVTQVSGRGVGLDVVKQRIEELGGSVSLDSMINLGTRITILAPVSSMMVNALAVRAGSCQCALAVESVVEITAASDGIVERPGNALAMRYGGDLIALRDLGAIMGLADVGEGDRIVILERDGLRCGLRVEQVLGERQIILRGKGQFLANSRILRDIGVSTDGVTTLVLDAGAIVDADEATVGPGAAAPATAAARVVAARIVIADDSELTRDLLARTLRERGHEIIEAVDGQDALAKIKEHSPDVVFTDLEMPTLDGFGLLTRLRETPQFRDLPVVVFTTRGGAEEVRRAAEAGATAYLVKGEFHERRLDQVLARLLGGRSTSGA